MTVENYLAEAGALTGQDGCAPEPRASSPHPLQ